MKKTVCELFAGVGGFRLGLENQSDEWETVWFSQWEPGASKQWAHDCYVSHFGESIDLDGNTETTGIDISEVDKSKIPNHNLLVGGFPCQDYSVARSLQGEKGIQGKKGVLWWQIRDTIIAKNPAFCLFENVDRLLKSPASQRGRDFGVMLCCLNQLEYSVEWRVINAATYGAAQRRRRTYIFAYRNDTKYAASVAEKSAESIIETDGFFARLFPIESNIQIKACNLPNDVADVSESFSFLFDNSGYMHNGEIYTSKIAEIKEEPIALGEILEKDVDESYYITPEKMDKWVYLKGAKKINRTARNGHEYIYSEGPVGFPDDLSKPGRTMLTSESTVNRSSHAVEDPDTKRIRIITPVEAERMQGFDDNWTNTMPQRMRYFCMGNALVVPMITRMGERLNTIMSCE